MGRRTRRAIAFWPAATLLDGVAIGTLVMVAATSASAQSVGDPAAAGSAFSRAKEALRGGDVEGACELFRESFRADPAPGALLNLAACDERRGRLASASQEFKDALAALPLGDSRVEFARERIAKLASRVPVLVLRAGPGLPADAEVSRDGQPVSPRSIGAPVPVDPREHEIRVRVAGHVDAVHRVTLREGETKELVLRPGPVDVEATERARARLEAAAGSRQPRVAGSPAPHRGGLLSWGLVGTGTLALATGTVLGLTTLDRASIVESRCTPGCDDVGYRAGQEGKWMSIASPVALGLGVVLVAAGVYRLLERQPTPSLKAAASW